MILSGSALFPVLRCSSTTFLKFRAMATVQSIVRELDRFAPFALAEKWDNVGLLLEPSTSSNLVRKILLTNDLTERVMDEAVQTQANMIISYHPPVFAPLKRITQASWKERIVCKCLENGIALFSPHTSWDAVEGGVNDWLFEILRLTAKTGTAIHMSDPATPNVGSGRIYDLTEAVPLDVIVRNVRTGLNLSAVQVARSANESVKRLAICAGSGAGCFKGVVADLYITGEMSHHEVLDAVHAGTNVILTNHSNSERGFLARFKERFQPCLPADVELLISACDEDPLQTHT